MRSGAFALLAPLITTIDDALFDPEPEDRWWPNPVALLIVAGWAWRLVRHRRSAPTAPAPAAPVEASEPDKLLLTLAVADSRVQRLAGSEVAVESTTERGIQRFAGTLKLHPRPELLEVVLSGETERIQRREWARVGATVPIRVKAVGDPIDTAGESSTLNISGGGVLVKD